MVHASHRKTRARTSHKGWPAPPQKDKAGRTTQVGGIGIRRCTLLSFLSICLFTLSAPGQEKMGCMKICRTFHITQGPGPHCFLLCCFQSLSRFRSRSKPVWISHICLDRFYWQYLARCSTQIYKHYLAYSGEISYFNGHAFNEELIWSYRCFCDNQSYVQQTVISY